MSHKKPKRWSIRFELAPEREVDAKLNTYLEALAQDDKASQWIRDTLIAALPADTPLIKGVSTVDKGSDEVEQVGDKFPLVHDDDMKPATPKLAPRQKTSLFQRNGAVIPPVSGAKDRNAR